MATTKLKLSAIFLATALCAAAVFGQGQNIGLETAAGRAQYRAGDTVVVGVRASIPHGYHLYANPLGPGIGKPLNLFVDRAGDRAARDGWDVAWVEARKSVPKRYNPQIGSWVWAYESEAYFFLKGVMTKDGAVDTAVSKTVTIDYNVTIDALICRTSCVPIEKSAAFSVAASTWAAADISPPAPGQKSLKACDITERLYPPAFPTAPKWQALYAKSEAMEFKTGSPAGAVQVGVDGGNQPQGGLKLDLGGLSGIGGIGGVGGIKDISDASDNNDNSGNSGINNVNDDGAVVWDYSPHEEKKREYNLLTAILFALIAGLALNLTPCIFPVLGIRVLSFAESARESRRRAVVRSLAFAGGIVAVFLLLAAFAAFAGFSWGQQFQNPGIMAGIIAIIFLFALGMFDYYTMAVPSAISNAERKAGANLTGDFLKGAAATVMATPCGGPFLGALLAWALLQKPLTIFVLFTVMGVGMATPYVLLSSSKKLMGLLPKPGRWIEDLKRVMGFLLIAFAVNLLRSLDPRMIVTAVGICLSILCAASVNRRFAPFGASVKKRVTVILISMALFAAGAAVSVNYLRIDIPLFNDDTANGAEHVSPAQWSDFSPQALKNAHGEGRNVIVSFTASWCTNCKLNWAAVINTAEARELYVEKNVVLLTADITNPNPQAQSLLHHLGSRSIPFVAVFPADSPKNPVIMRDILSKDRYLGMVGGLP